MVDEYLF